MKDTDKKLLVEAVDRLRSALAMHYPTTDLIKIMAEGTEVMMSANIRIMSEFDSLLQRMSQNIGAIKKIVEDQ